MEPELLDSVEEVVDIVTIIDSPLAAAVTIIVWILRQSQRLWCRRLLSFLLAVSRGLLRIPKDAV